HLERVPQRLVEIAERLRLAPGNVPERLAQLLDDEPEAPRDLERGLQAVTWFIDYAGDKGVALTSAEYIKPAGVREVSDLMPTMVGYLFGIHREIDTCPVLLFREALQRLGVLRKSR